MRCASYTVATQSCAAGEFGSVANALRAASSAFGTWLFWRRSLPSRACSPALTMVLSRCAIASPSAAGVPGLPLDTGNSAAKPEPPMSRTRMVATSPTPARSSVPVVYALTLRKRASSCACDSSSSTSHAKSDAFSASHSFVFGITTTLYLAMLASRSRAASMTAMLTPESAGVFTLSGNSNSFSVGCWMASCAGAAPATATTNPATSRRILTRGVLSRCGLVPQWAKRDSNPRPPACKAGALNQLSYSPVAPRGLKGEAYREENAVTQDEQNRRCGRRPAGQQPVAAGERHEGRGEEQPVLGSEVQARARQTLVGHSRTVYPAIPSSSSSWAPPVLLRHRPALVQQRPARPVPATAQPDEPHEHQPHPRPEHPRRPRPRQPAVAARDVALPPRLEVAFGHVIGGAQRRVERRLTRQIVDQRPEPALTAPPIEQHPGGRRQR